MKDSFHSPLTMRATKQKFKSPKLRKTLNMGQQGGIIVSPMLFHCKPQHLVVRFRLSLDISLRLVTRQMSAVYPAITSSTATLARSVPELAYSPVVLTARLSGAVTYFIARPTGNCALIRFVVPLRHEVLTTPWPLPVFRVGEESISNFFTIGAAISHNPRHASSKRG